IRMGIDKKTYAFWSVFMAITITTLRSNLYKIVDNLIKTGTPIEIERHGKLVKMGVVQKSNKLARLKSHKKVINGDNDDIVHADWSANWHKDKHL
ncbi:MAG: hypothetical protein ACK4PR_12475, partial [Gammaproteobacteria bacterium]